MTRSGATRDVGEQGGPASRTLSRHGAKPVVASFDVYTVRGAMQSVVRNSAVVMHGATEWTPETPTCAFLLPRWHEERNLNISVRLDEDVNGRDGIVLLYVALHD